MVDEMLSFVLDVYCFGQTRCIRVENSVRRSLLKFGTLCRIMRRHIPVTLATTGNSNPSRQATVGIRFVKLHIGRDLKALTVSSMKRLT